MDMRWLIENQTTEAAALAWCRSAVQKCDVERLRARRWLPISQVDATTFAPTRGSSRHPPRYRNTPKSGYGVAAAASFLELGDSVATGACKVKRRGGPWPGLPYNDRGRGKGPRNVLRGSWHTLPWPDSVEASPWSGWSNWHRGRFASDTSQPRAPEGQTTGPHATVRGLACGDGWSQGPAWQWVSSARVENWELGRSGLEREWAENEVRARLGALSIFLFIFLLYFYFPFSFLF
jgi:hypothetical protein